MHGEGGYEFRISDRAINSTQPPYLIAEISANHEQDLELTLDLISECAAAGFDAIKVQTYTPDTMTLRIERPEYVVRSGLWDQRHLHELYSEASMPWEWTRELGTAANEQGLAFFSTPFDETAVIFLESVGVPAYKIASFEVTDIPLLEVVGATGKPVIVSTGMATFCEIEQAVRTLRGSGCREIALLKCTSAYPAALDDLNLATIRRLEDDFKLPIGFSDHTLGVAAAAAAVVAGAVIVEKHVRACDRVTSPDAAFSLPACQFTSFVEQISLAFQMRGTATYGATLSEESSMRFRRSVIAKTDIELGETFTQNNLTVRRPNIGAEPSDLPLFLGMTASRHIGRGEGVCLEDRLIN